MRCNESETTLKYAVRVGNQGRGVKDIPYIVKEKATNDYMWAVATFYETI